MIGGECSRHEESIGDHRQTDMIQLRNLEYRFGERTRHQWANSVSRRIGHRRAMVAQSLVSGCLLVEDIQRSMQRWFRPVVDPPGQAELSPRMVSVDIKIRGI